MKIESISISNYRCLYNFSMPLEGYTVCIGQNGAGKSTVLLALAWFFGHPQVTSPQTNEDSPDEKISVSVTFEGVRPDEAKHLGNYVQAGAATFNRHYDPANDRSWYEGKTLLAPGAQSVLEAAAGPGKRNAYRRLREIYPSLEELPGNAASGAINASVSSWGNDPENSALLTEEYWLKCDELFGADGALRKLVTFVFVPGSADLSAEIGGVGRGSTLSTLTASLVASALAKAKENWEAKNVGVLEELAEDSANAIGGAVEQHQQAINSALHRYVPEVEVLLESTPPAVVVRNESNIETLVQVRGRPAKDVTMEGHGTQRAVMMAMVQAISEVPRPPEQVGPLLVIAAEEPEIFQHPVRVRAFAKSLAAISDQPDGQVIVATHSPYFVRPDQFHALRRIAIAEGRSTVSYATTQQVAANMDVSVNDLTRNLVKELPKTFSEGFFSSCVLLIEGDTDFVVLDVAADLLGKPLESYGVTIFSVEGKTSFKKYFHLLSSLGVRVYIVADGDFDPDEEDQLTIDRKRGQTEGLLRVQSPCDKHGANLGYQFGQPTCVGYQMTVFSQSIEKELDGWSSYIRERGERGPKKDAHVYRRAARLATDSDMPTDLRSLVESIVCFASE